MSPRNATYEESIPKGKTRQNPWGSKTVAANVQQCSPMSVMVFQPLGASPGCSFHKTDSNQRSAREQEEPTPTSSSQARKSGLCHVDTKRDMTRDVVQNRAAKMGVHLFGESVDPKISQMLPTKLGNSQSLNHHELSASKLQLSSVGDAPYAELFKGQAKKLQHAQGVVLFQLESIWDSKLMSQSIQVCAHTSRFAQVETPGVCNMHPETQKGDCFKLYPNMHFLCRFAMGTCRFSCVQRKPSCSFPKRPDFPGGNASALARSKP